MEEIQRLTALLPYWIFYFQVVNDAGMALMEV